MRAPGALLVEVSPGPAEDGPKDLACDSCEILTCTHWHCAPSTCGLGRWARTSSRPSTCGLGRCVLRERQCKCACRCKCRASVDVMHIEAALDGPQDDVNGKGFSGQHSIGAKACSWSGRGGCAKYLGWRRARGWGASRRRNAPSATLGGSSDIGSWRCVKKVDGDGREGGARVGDGMRLQLRSVEQRHLPRTAHRTCDAPQVRCRWVRGTCPRRCEKERTEAVVVRAAVRTGEGSSLVCGIERKIDTHHRPGAG